MTRVDGRAPDAAPPTDGAAPRPRQVFDLSRAVEAARAEADGRRDSPVTCGGQEFTAPVMDEWDEEATELLTEGRFAAALSLVLGEGEYRRLREAAGGSMKLGMIKLLFDHFAGASGMGGVGESSASNASLRNITRR
jgi:hypothetical protein